MVSTAMMIAKRYDDVQYVPVGESQMRLEKWDTELADPNACWADEMCCASSSDALLAEITLTAGGGAGQLK